AHRGHGTQGVADDRDPPAAGLKGTPRAVEDGHAGDPAERSRQPTGGATRGMSAHAPALTDRGSDVYCDAAIPDAGAPHGAREDERVLACHHTRPCWQVHLVVVPKRHIASLTAAGPEDETDLRALLTVVTDVARQVEREHGAAAVLTNLGDYQ